MLFWFVDPIVNVEITAIDIPTIYQPLTLHCNATIIRGITGTVDIIWTTGDTQVRRVNNVTPSSTINFTSVYNDSFVTPSLNISDIQTVYQCKVVVNSVVLTTTATDFIIPIPGMYIMYVHNYNYFFFTLILCANVTRFEMKFEFNKQVQ